MAVPSLIPTRPGDRVKADRGAMWFVSLNPILGRPSQE
ncbi:protein of unknown function [Kyrpidia spormannii]|uniref:Uncharacterized protein n=2 Tax=Kyrpidia spormannii TaxID=2055160 RepID=A0ACA8ZBF4_9BACL|nr:protein of unknown function [Kyrpidia spormannii]CAB3395108.1 protein of unknown function [Kyrpidia spormannii]